jgi:RimJ/RimL family protein N-acetyltransferase
MYLNKIETRRLKFRTLTTADTKIWESFFINNPNLEYLGLDNSLNIQEQSIDWINRQLERYKCKRFGHHALIEKHSGKFIGQAGILTQEIEGKTEIEIGYHILPVFWRQGFATEAALKIRDFAFENEIASSLISIIDIRNKGSQRVAEKLRMKVEKQIKLYGLNVFIYRVDNYIINK